MQLSLPPDPPEKWKTFQAALETTSKTVRLCAILLVSGISLGLVIAAIALVRR